MSPVRTGLTLGLVVATVVPAAAQGIRMSPTTQPFRPAVVRPIYPAYAYPPFPRPWPYRPATIWPAYGLGYYPYAPGVLYGSSYYSAPPTGFGTVPTAPPLQGAGGTPLDIVPTSPELTAELTIEFPAAAEVTVNGAAAPGEGKVRTLTSPALSAGLTHTFAVKARWTKNGQAYEWERTVTLGPGERSRLTVARGFPVSDKE